jgi:adenosylhomocysteinase
MEGLRTEHFREFPAFEFILQEWLFNLEKDVQRSLGLNPWKHDYRAQIATVVDAHIDQQLATLRIHDSSFGKALRSYYAAAQYSNDIVATAAANWLKGIPTLSANLRPERGIRGGVAKENAFDFLRAMATLIVHIGYAGLLVIFDEAELICGIARAESRNAAYENIRLLMDWTAQGDFAHCGFLFAGAEDLLSDDRRGVPSYPSLYEQLKPPAGRSKTPEFRQPLLELAGFQETSLSEMARKVREVHGVAYGWQPDQRLTDDLLNRLIQEAAAQVGEAFRTVPRGFLKVLIDVLDEIQRYPHVAASEVIRVTDYVERIEEVERQEAHLTESL